MSDRRRVLGIDPGLIVTGYGCVEMLEAGPRVVEAGVFKLPARAPLADRLNHLHEDLTGLLQELLPDVMVVEQLFSHYRHARTAILMAHARGVVLLAASARGIEVDHLLPTEVKKAIAGNGHATKRQMQEAVRAQCRLATLPTPHDVADALAIALCAARRMMSAAPA